MGVAFRQSRRKVSTLTAAQPLTFRACKRSIGRASAQNKNSIGIPDHPHPHIRLRFSRHVGDTVLAARSFAVRSIDSRAGDQRWDRAAIIRLSRLMELFSLNITGPLEVILSPAP
jgi:hypothetical protein